MEEVITIANRLGGVSFATLLLVILWGSWKRIWVWGHDIVEMEARFKIDLQRVQDESNWWRGLAIKATGIAEIQGQVLRVKENKELAKIDDANKRLINGIE